MPIKQVVLDYGRDRAAVRYAAALAEALEAELVVRYTPPDGVSLTDIVADETQRRMLADVMRQAPRANRDLYVVAETEGPPEWQEQDALIVSNEVMLHPALPVWWPAYEQTLRTRDGPVVVPFGNKPVLERAYRFGVDLAAQLHRPVMFYHSTWPRAGVVSQNGRDHWHEGAAEVAACAVAYAEACGVAHELVIECAGSVVEGTHRAALTARACCVVIQKDAHVIAGGYDKQLRERNHLVPIVMLPNGGLQ